MLQFKNHFLITIIFLVISMTAVSQVPVARVAKFDANDFSKKFETARWLVEYDEVAWKTSDVLLTEDKAEIAKLGREWFCFQDAEKKWHAVYGRLDNNKYVPVFHYTFDRTGKIASSSEKLDGEFLTSHANALSTARTALKEKIPVNAPVFNQYILRNPDKTFQVWMLPAFQPNGVAVYGGEGVYKIDAAGTRVVEDHSYFQKEFRGFNSDPPREIWLDYTELEKPTLGAIFFVWYYKSYFTKIFVNNLKSTSTVITDPKTGPIWVHVEKEDKPAKP